MTQANWRFENLSVHAGYQPDPTTKALAVPIYQTAAFAFDSAQHGADLFDMKVPGSIYSRIMNPTNDVLEQRLAALEGGVSALALASGQAAVTCSFLTIAEASDNIVSSTALYGGTYNLFAHTLPQYGITTHRQLGPDELQRDGVGEDTVRLSVCIEHIDDLSPTWTRRWPPSEARRKPGARPLGPRFEMIQGWLNPPVAPAFLSCACAPSGAAVAASTAAPSSRWPRLSRTCAFCGSTSRTRPTWWTPSKWRTSPRCSSLPATSRASSAH